MVFRWPIEIDGLPFLKMVIFHGKLLNNQMVTGCFFGYEALFSVAGTWELVFTSLVIVSQVAYAMKIHEVSFTGDPSPTVTRTVES